MHRRLPISRGARLRAVRVRITSSATRTVCQRAGLRHRVTLAERAELCVTELAYRCRELLLFIGECMDRLLLDVQSAA